MLLQLFGYIEKGIESDMGSERIIKADCGADFQPRMGNDHFPQMIICRSVSRERRQYLIESIVRCADHCSVGLLRVRLVHFQDLEFRIINDKCFTV